LTAANERIHFTKHSSGSALNLLQSHSQHKCRTSIVALEDAPQYLLGTKRSATKLVFARVCEESLRRGNRCVHGGVTYCVQRGISLLRCGFFLILHRGVILCCIADLLLLVCAAAQSLCALPHAAFAACSGLAACGARNDAC
jgi:hypothetical protein